MIAVENELNAYGLLSGAASLIREKDGVTVARVKAGDDSFILKYFGEGVSLRELDNYRILASLGVPTLRVFGMTKRSILMEDIEASPVLRLGREEDMNDPEVVGALAAWYGILHERGEAYVRAHGEGMYDEWDVFTPENLDLIPNKLGSECDRAVKALKERFSELRSQMDAVPKTLCYNDFYYTNMAVRKDKSAAIMFDYNFLGKGCRANDILNAVYWFSEENKALFIKEYGGADEALFELVRRISPVVDLISALKRGIFPGWAKEAKEELVKIWG